MQFRDPSVGFHRRSGRDHRFRAHTPGLARGPSRPRRARRLGVDDFWSTPLATLEKGAGDYEDYAILKYLAYWLQSLVALILRFTARLISPSRARPARCWRARVGTCTTRPRASPPPSQCGPAHPSILRRPGVRFHQPRGPADQRPAQQGITALSATASRLFVAGVA